MVSCGLLSRRLVGPALDAKLATKGQLYKQWLVKQCSGFCGMQQMVARWDPERDVKCPDCGCEERASHLNICYNPEWMLLLTRVADSISIWLHQNLRASGDCISVLHYIKLCGTRFLSDMPGMSANMRRVARSQDLIPWKDFNMVGKLEGLQHGGEAEQGMVLLAAFVPSLLAITAHNCGLV